MVKRVPTDRDSDTTTDDVTVMRATTGGGGGSSVETPRVLKQRFVLDQKLGSGGMGTVYQAKDLRKVEARDRYPFVAIKVLNNDFRAHPDAFIALQREASKSQAIAHPNIVSIFDFDKDGDIPYMTMELLEGKELAELLREFPNGMPDALLWPILEGLCAGLKRAHDAGIIHADLKPGNVFVTKGGVPKILDFGIARAVRTHQYEGEETVFDPAKLAALTPAYASAQMLDGEAPTPADDIYSFGVVAYLMLTGRHPFDRMRADEAARQGLVPERVKRLKTRQWRVLERALSFDREVRPQSMDEVIARLLRPSPARPWLVTGFVVVVVATAMLLWLGPPNVERAAVARDAVSGAQVGRIDALLTNAAFDVTWHERVVEELTALNNVDQGRSAAAARQRVLETYGQKIAQSVDLDMAALWLARADSISPEGRFDDGRRMFEDRLRARLAELLAEPVADSEWHADIAGVLERHAVLYPGSLHRVDMERAVVARYLESTAALTAAGDVSLARALIADARHLGGDAALIEQLGETLRLRDTDLARARADSARRTDARAVDREMEQLSQTACQRLNVRDVAAATSRLRARFPNDSRRIDAGVGDMIARCVVSVGATDRDRAVAMQREAVAVFPDSVALREARLDPCGMGYLTGRGNQPGRGGFCVDDLRDGGTGPRLVVVPIGDTRLAVTKYEVSWKALAAFCAESTRCAEVREADAPVRDIEVDTVRAYIEWLNTASGRTYRLPTAAEWRAVVGEGAPDPNRNCRLQAAGVSRGAAPLAVSVGSEGPWGLANALGNVREWVMDGDALAAAGGSFADPIAECVATTVVPHDGTADAMTGFRLVREVQ